MRRTNRSTLLIAILTILSVMAVPLAAQESAPESIDVVIALDVSGTMKGLIDSARLKLWEIVNDLADVEPAPRLRVGLITFGNQSPGTQQDGWVRVETDLTEDLDLLSARLFSLRSRGAQENLGRVLQMAIQRLSWSDSENAVKLLFVAGNEAADQDRLVRFREMSALAREQGILVSAIFCGRPTDPAAATWKEMAELSAGEFHSIDHNKAVVVIETPFDEQLARLGDELNNTYVPARSGAIDHKRNQAKQDRNASALNKAVAASRAQTKASRLYQTDWDFVDAVESGKLDLSNLDESQLSSKLQRMSTDERLIYFEDLRNRREQIGLLIGDLAAERRQFISDQAQKRGLDQSRAFDSALRRTLRTQAEEQGFSFPTD
ncbi:MAG: VWA domain-containing protein [Acidobacteriota bacterium]|nr:VWA domain-containing protein [Acidobacteriota bacterium]